MKKNIARKFLSILLTIAAIFALSSCGGKSIKGQIFDETKLADMAPAEYKLEIPDNLYKDIDDIDLSAFIISSKKTDVADNGDGTTTAIAVTVYSSEDNRTTVEIGENPDGSFNYATVSQEDEAGITSAYSHYSAPYKEIDSVVFDRKSEISDSHSQENYITAYFDDETFMNAVYTYTVFDIKGNVSTPAYISSAVYTTQGKLAAIYVSVTGESECRYFNSKYEPVSHSVYSIIVASIQYSEYLMTDEKISSFARAKLEIKLPAEVTEDFSKFKKTDDYVLSDTKANYYGEDLKDDYGNPFNTTTTFYKNEKNGYSVDMTVVDESEYLFIAHISCETPRFAVTYRENGILDNYIDYDNHCRFSCNYNTDFSPSYYAMAYSVLCKEGANATADIICDYDTEMKLLRYSVEYSFGLTIYYNAAGNMIEYDEFDLLNTVANYE